MTAKHRLQTLLSLLFLCLFPVFANAATIEFRTFIDADNSSATGCTLAGVNGVEHVVVTEVTTDATSASVTRSYRLACTAGSLGGQLDVITSGWPVGFNPASGGMVVENRIPLSVFGGMPTGMRLVFDATNGGVVHVAGTTPSGGTIIYPKPPGKRHSVSPGPNGRTFVLDGNANDWGSINPVANGIASGGNQSIRMIAAYAFANPNPSDAFLYFRVDANVGSDSPFAEDDAYSRPPGAGLTVPAPGVLSNDGDPNGQPLTALPVAPATHGEVTLNSDGSFTYSPNDPASSQTDSFQYKATNGTKDSNLAKVTITVSTATNGAPTALNDNHSTNEDQVLNVGAPGVMGNDSDPNGDPLTASKTTNPAHGTAVVNTDGSFTYTPNANFFGTDSFTYTITDDEGLTSTATVTITITGVNDAPQIAPDDFSVNENSPNGTVVGTLTSTDVENHSRSFSIIAGNVGGTFAISSSGVITVANNAGLDYEGQTSFNLTVRVTDNGVPPESGDATILINVNNINETPVAVNDSGTVAEDGTLSVPAPGLLANDVDPESGALTASKVSDPANGVATVSANGAWTYQPNANFNGTDSFTYQVSDGTNTSNVATVTITVTAVNDTPTFTSGGNVTVAEDTAFNATWATAISAGPADESGQALTFNVSNDNNALFSVLPSISPAGVLTFTPVANANGTANVTVTLSDNGGGANTSAPQNFVITVTEVNDPPTATNDATSAVEDTPLAFAAATLTTNDSAGPANESGQTLTVTGVSATSAQGGTVTLVAGTITYTPAANYNGPDSFTYTVTDNGTTSGAADPQSAVGTVNVTVSEVNDAPTANNDATAAQEDTQLIISAGSLATNDSAGPANESAQTLTVTAVSAVSAQGGTVTLVFGAITYIPPPNYFGADSFTYTVTDNGTTAGAAAPLSAGGTVNVTVAPINDVPVLTVSGAATHTEGGAATNVATAASIADVDDTNIESATIQITGNFAAGQDVLSFVNTPNITGVFSGDTLTLTGTDTLANYAAALQTVQYTNTSDTPSTLQRTITWTVNDGTANSNTQTTTLDVTATNDGPQNSVPGGQTVGEDAPLTFSTANSNLISIADADAASDDVQVTINVTNGTVTLNPAATAALTTLSGDGTATVTITGTVAEINAVLDGMVFAATPNYVGPAQIQIVTDDLGNNPSGALQDTDVVPITVTAVNDAPVLTVTGAVTHTEGAAATNLATAANITDVDDTNIESATVQITGNYGGAEDVLSFVNTPNITGNVVGDTLTLTGTDTLANYIAALQAVQYTNTSDTPSTLQRTITWTVNDGDANSNTQTTTLDVTATNDGPTNTVAAGLSTDEDVPLVINGASIADVDADPDDVQITLNVTGGTVTLDATATGALTSLTNDGTAAVVATGTVAEINAALSGMTFTPTLDSSGMASIQMVTDDLGNNPSGALQDTDSFDITVNPLNDAPVLTVTGSPTFAENGPAQALASAVNITDVDDTNIESATITITNVQTDDALNFVNTPNITGNFAGGVLTLTGSDTEAAYIAALQSITFSNASDNPSTVQRTLTWVVSDGDINSNTQNTTVDVTATNDAPVNTVPGTQATNEDTPLVLSSATFFTTDPDSDPDDVQVTFTITNGTLTLNAAATGALTSLTGDGTGSVVATGTVAEVNAAINGASFTPALDFSGTATIQIATNDQGNNPSGAITDTDSFDITVTAQNDAPVLTVTGSPTFAENGSAVAVAGTVNITDVDDTNIESATITITNVQTGDVLNFVNTPNITGNFVGGVLTLTGSDTEAAYIAALQSITFSNASDNPSITQRAITWVVNDGDTNSNTQNTTVDVTATNDAPVNTVAVGVTTNEDTPVVINGASIADPDADPDDVQITLNVTGGTVSLDPTATGALATLSNDGTATVVATGTVAEINAALSGMTFTPTADSNSGTVAAAIQMVTNDQGNNPDTPITDTDSFSITVNAVNDAPSFTAGANPTINEDHGPYSESGWATNITAGPSDESSQNLTMQATVTGTTGTLTFMTVPSVNVVSGNLAFQANANTCGSATVDVTLSDDGTPVGTSPTHLLTITVQCVNDMPSYTPGGSQTVDEDAGAQTVNPWATAISPGAGETDNLTFNVSNDNNALFTAGGQPAISPTGVLTYTPAPNANGVANVSVTLSDDGVPPMTTTPATAFTITVNALNDAPAFTFAGDPPFVLDGAGAQTVNGFATGITDGDPELTQALTFNRTNGATTGTLTFDALPAIDPATGNLTYTPTAGTNGTAAFTFTLSDDGATGGSNVNVSASQGFTIAVEVAPTVTLTSPADNDTGVSTSTNITVTFSEPVSVTLAPASFKINCNAGSDLAFAYVGGTTNVTSVTLDPTSALPAGNCVVTVVAAEIHDADSFDPPDGLAADFTFDFVTNTPPTATDDGAFALGNVTLNVSAAQGVLANDTDPDAGATLTVDLTFGTGNPYTTSAGGKVTFAADGSYTYLSEAGDQNIAADTVTYQVTDQFGGTDTGTLTINLGPRYIYVDDTGVAGNGTDVSPFHTLQAAQAGSTVGDTILVKEGTYNTANDFITLKTNQSLIGQGVAAPVVHSGHGPGNFTVLSPGGEPSIARATAGVTIDLAQTVGNVNTIRGVLLGAAATGTAINGVNFGTLNVSESSVNVTGGRALLLNNGALNLSFDSLTANGGITAITLLNTSGTVTASAGTLGPASDVVSIDGGSVSVTYGGAVTQSNIGPAVAVSNGHTGTLTFNGNVTSTNGTGLVFNNADGTYNFNGTNAISGVDIGIRIQTGSGGTFSFSSNTSITNPSSTGFRVNNSTITSATYAGTITLNAGGTARPVDIDLLAGGAVTLSGAISSNAAGILVQNSAAGTVTFSGATTLNTTTNAAVTLSANGAATSFTSGSLQITTTTGAGFVATGAAGQVNVTGAANTISTGTGTPFSMSGGVDIGASGVTFRSISANGATFGIELSATGTGVFTLTGTGTAGTGGTLQSIGGSAVSLDNTAAVNLSHLTINGASTGISAGVFGTLTLRDLAVTATSGLSLNTGTVNNAPASTAFTSLTSTGGTNGVSMTSVNGSFNVSSGSLSGASGSTFLVNGGNVGGTWSTNITKGSAGAVVDISNGHSGALTFAATVSATTGSGLQFANADGNYNFSGAATLSGGAGIDIVGTGDATDGSQGTFTFDGDSSIGNTTGQLVDIQNSKPSFTYSGTFTKTNANVGINLTGNQGGTITFNGTGTKTININSGTSNAINMDNNDGCVISFGGNNLQLTTQTGNAFHAINGGTVTLTGTGNTASTTGGAGVNIVSTTIGGGGVTFQSVTATGGTSGIILTTTGSGFFTVTGTGSTDGNGGVISGTTGPGINLSGTGAISLTNMNIQNSGDDGIRGATVAGFNLTNLNITSNGNAVNERGIDLTQLSGSGSMTGMVFSGSAEDHIKISNSSGILSSFNVTSSTFNATTMAAPGNDAFLVEMTGTGTMNISVTGSTFTDSRGDHFQATSTASSTGSMTVTFNNNTLNTTAGNDPNVLGGGITINPGGGADFTVEIAGNNIQQSFDAAINVNHDPNSLAGGHLSLKVNNNIIGTSGVADSASESDRAITVSGKGAGSNTISVTNNTIRQWGNEYGIFVGIMEGSASMDATVTGNNVQEGGTFALNAIRAEAGATAGPPADNGTLCVTLTGNTASYTGGTDIRVRQAFSTTVRLPGYVGANNDTTAVANFVLANNTATDATAAHNVPTGGGFVGGAACPTP